MTITRKRVDAVIALQVLSGRETRVTLAPRVRAFLLVQDEDRATPHGAHMLQSCSSTVYADQYIAPPRKLIGKNAIDAPGIEVWVSEYDYTPRCVVNEPHYSDVFYLTASAAAAKASTLAKLTRALERRDATLHDTAATDEDKAVAAIKELASFFGAARIARYTPRPGRSHWGDATWEPVEVKHAYATDKLIRRAIADMKSHHRPNESAVRRHQEEQAANQGAVA